MKDMKLLKRYKFFILLIVLYGLLGMYSMAMGEKALLTAGDHLLQMLAFIPPIFVLLGLLDVWLEKETVIRFMGDKSGYYGTLLAFFIGSAAAGPLYGAFPIAVAMMRKGCSMFNVFVFLGAWSTTKIPMLTFEIANMGVTFALVRLMCSILGILIIATTINHLLTDEEKIQLYKKAEAS